MNKRVLIVCLLFAAVFSVLPGFATALFLTWALFYFVRHATSEADRKVVVSLLAASLAVRVILFCALQYFIFSRGLLDIFGDGQDNIIQGMIFNDYFRGAVNLGKILTAGRYNTHSMTFFNSIFFTLFGNDIISLKYFNILAVTAAGWLVYDFLRRAYSSAAGKAAAAIFLFWPTLILWTLTDLKEAHLIFCLVAIFSILAKLSGRVNLTGRILYIFLLATLLSYAVFLKYKLLFPIASLSAAAISFYYLSLWFYKKGARPGGRFICFSLFFAGAIFLRFHGLIIQKAVGYYGIILSYNRGFISTGGWNYDLLGNRPEAFQTVPFFIKYLLGGWFHFMTEPLPWHAYSYSLLVAVPLMLFWYLLLFFSIVGLVRLKIAGRIAVFIPMLIFTFLYVTVLGMAVANIGTAIRFRDAIMPVVVMLASCAFCLPVREKEGV